MSAAVISRLASAIVLSCLLSAPSAAQSRGVAGESPFPSADPTYTENERADRFAELPSMDLATAVRCAARLQKPQETHKVPRVIGWLYRWVRGFDIERSSTPSPQLYLRSPLLAGFNEPVDCPVPEVELRAQTCVAVTARDARDRSDTYLVTLPRGGARTPSELEALLTRQLGAGERVPLRTLAGTLISLDPARALAIAVKPCGPEIG